MSSEHFHQFFPVVCAGFGLTLVGAANLLLLGRGVLWRVLASLLALAVAVGGASAINLPGVVPRTLQLLAFTMVPVLLLGSARSVARLGAVCRGANHPMMRFTLVTAAGIGTVVGSVVVFQITDDAVNQQGISDLTALEGPCGSVDSVHAKAATDRGTTIVLKEPAMIREAALHAANEARILAAHQLTNQVISRGPADDRSNCHGWVFTGGIFRLGPNDVQVILTENAYQEVHEPHPGDLVIYRTNGAIAHSAVVRYVTEGQPVLVEGKWGSLGVMLHAVDRSVYGTDYTFYRSHRTGHLLVGVGGHAPMSEARPAVVSE